jgi:hypothetical protein
MECYTIGSIVWIRHDWYEKESIDARLLSNKEIRVQDI